MKNFWRALFSRTFMLLAIAVVQIGVFVWLTGYFSYARIGSAAYSILTIACTVVAVLSFERDNLNPAYKMMWMLLIVAAPLSGTLFYLWWGSRRITQKRSKSLIQIEHNVDIALKKTDALAQRIENEFPQYKRSITYLEGQRAPIYCGTKSEYFPLGQNFFSRFTEQLKTAKQYIFLEYFIIEEGKMWNSTLDILKQKAAEGVDVRVIYDGLACMSTLPTDYDRLLRSYGIKCFVFNDAHFSLHISDYKMLNHRDHRKITVIDGETGFSGGLNFADEYINEKQRFGVWKDTGFMLKGPAVYTLTLTFLSMWDFVTNSMTDYSAFKPVGRYTTDGYVQPYCDSPVDNENIAESAYFNIIDRADKYVWIVTPYLVIDHEMLTSLCLAAKSGVDVRIMTPGIPDKWYVYYVTQSYYSELLQAGVRIFEYTPGFIHAKMYVSDDKVAIVGSANMDYRSLYLHFENCCSFYGGHMPGDVKKDFLETQAECREVTPEDVRSVPIPKRFLQILLRVFAPMM